MNGVRDTDEMVAIRNETLNKMYRAADPGMNWYSYLDSEETDLKAKRKKHTIAQEDLHAILDHILDKYRCTYRERQQLENVCLIDMGPWGRPRRVLEDE